MFRFGALYIGPKACAANRTAMISGSSATMQCFQVSNTGIDGMLPSNLDGATAPPAGATNYFLVQGPSGSNTLQMYKFHADFSSRKPKPTFTGPTNIAVAAYTPASAGVPQPGTTQTLDSLGNFLMHRLVYRNFTGTGAHESLVATHTVSIGGTMGMRWYEIRSPGSAPAVYQQGTFSPDSTYRWMGSIAMDKQGNIALGYSASDGSSVKPSIRYTGRVPSDPPGTMQTEATFISGTGVQTGGLSRWGDYSSMSVDPVDGCTMWYAQEWIPSDGSFNWATRLSSFKFTGCQ
jgi:hypothetical protein